MTPEFRAAGALVCLALLALDVWSNRRGLW